MTVGDLSDAALRSRLAAGGCLVRIGPFLVRVRSPFANVREYLASHYRDFAVEDDHGGCHFSIGLLPPFGVRRFVRRQAVFVHGSARPFNPVPVRLAPGMLEWGLNWCIGMRVHHWLVIHAAVVERHGFALILPAVPGSGKSTLAAALAFEGWRLLSDEFAVVDVETGLVHAVPRPVALKGASMGVIGRRVPAARFGPLLEDQDRQTMRHLAPPPESVRRAGEPATPAWLISPVYSAGATTTFEPVLRARMLAHLADSSFNYNALGPRSFARLADVVDASTCGKFTYSDLDEAVPFFTRLADERAAVAERT